MAVESNSVRLAKLREAGNSGTAASARLKNLFDNGEFTVIDAYVNGGNTGVIAAYGFIEGNPVYAYSQDVTVNGGAVNKAHADKICKVLDLAAETGAPVVSIFDSNGGFIDSGAEILNAYGDILMRTGNLSGVVPQISVVAGVCAGTAALVACSSDFVICTKDAELFANVSADNTSAENAAKNGMAQLVCEDDNEAMIQARKLVSMLPSNNLAPVPVFEFSANTAPCAGDAETMAFAVADDSSIVELSADFGTAAYTALASVGGMTVGIAATNKSDSRLTSDDCVKLARFVRTCDAFAVPVITFVDTEGFDGADAVRDMTKLAHAYAEATTVKLAVVTGKAYGAAFIALAGKNANSDMTFAYSDATISPVAPVTAVEFLMHDKLRGAEDVKAKRSELTAEYAREHASAFDAADKAAVNDIILPSETRGKLVSALDILSFKRVSRMPKKHSNIQL